MGTPKPKLEIYTEKNFLINWYAKNKDDGFTFAFKEKVLNPERHIIKDFKGNIYDTRMFEDAIIQLSEIKDPSYLLDKKIRIDPLRDILSNNKVSPHSLCLVEQSENENDISTNDHGILFFESNRSKHFFSKLCLNEDRSFETEKSIPTTTEGNLPFDYTLLKKYILPTKFFTIFDPYISTWNEETIKLNLVEIFKNIISVSSVNNITHIRVVSKFDVKSSEKQWFNKEKNYAEFISKTIRKNFLGNYKIEVLILNEYLLIKEHPLFDLFKKLHDRFFYTSYLYGKSEHSFDYNIRDRVSKK